MQLTQAIPVRRHDMAQAFFFKTLSTKKFIIFDRSSASAVFSAIQESRCCQRDEAGLRIGFA